LTFAFAFVAKNDKVTLHEEYIEVNFFVYKLTVTKAQHPKIYSKLEWFIKSHEVTIPLTLAVIFRKNEETGEHWPLEVYNLQRMRKED
jgi:hypothetical protein